jgi:hypothetical protein
MLSAQPISKVAILVVCNIWMNPVPTQCVESKEQNIMETLSVVYMSHR